MDWEGIAVIIGRNIKRARDEVGMKQCFLAKRVGVTPSAMNRFEQGKKMPSLRTMIKIGFVLKKDIDWIIYSCEECEE